MRRKSKREKLNSMWEETHKKQNGPDWALSVLDGVVSSVLSSSVVLCWLQCDWLQLDSGCESSIGSVVTASVSDSVLLECFVFVSTSVTSNTAQNSIARAEAFKKNVILVGRLVSVWIICCTERCHATSVWVDVVSSLVSVSIWCWHWGVCRCKLWPASMCLKMGGKRRRDIEGGGTKCSSVPKTPHPLEVWVVVVALVLECEGEEWVGYQSYIVMLNGCCLVVLSPCVSGDIWPSVW